YESERPDAGRRKVERRRGAQATCADEQHAGVQKLPLARGADLGEDDLARIALRLGQRERLAGRPPGHRRDHRYLVLCLQIGLQSVQVLDRLLVDVHVDEAMNRATLVKYLLPE